MALFYEDLVEPTIVKQVSRQDRVLPLHPE